MTEVNENAPAVASDIGAQELNQVQDTAGGGNCQAPPYEGEQLYDDRLVELSQKMKEVISIEHQD